MLPVMKKVIDDGFALPFGEAMPMESGGPVPRSGTPRLGGAGEAFSDVRERGREQNGVGLAVGWLRAIVLILGRYGASLRFPILFFAVARSSPSTWSCRTRSRHRRAILALMALMLASFKRKPLPSPRSPS